MATTNSTLDDLKGTTWITANGDEKMYFDLKGNAHRSTGDPDGWRLPLHFSFAIPGFHPEIEYDVNGRPYKQTYQGDEWQRVELKPHEAIGQVVSVVKGLCQDASKAVDMLSPSKLGFVCSKQHNCFNARCYESKLRSIHSVVSTCIADTATLIEGINTECEVIKAEDEFEDAYEQVRKLEPTITKDEFHNITSEMDAMPNTDKLTRPLLEFHRDRKTVLRVHANVVADISSVFAKHVKDSPGEPICMDKDPWKNCEVNTLKIIAYFAYLGLHQHVTNAVDTMEPSQREALYALVNYLESKPMGSDLAGKDTPSKLREFKKLVTTAIRKRARELVDDDE